MGPYIIVEWTAPSLSLSQYIGHSYKLCEKFSSDPKLSASKAQDKAACKGVYVIITCVLRASISLPLCHSNIVWHSANG